MNDTTGTPYQRDYLQILGFLSAVGALLFGLFLAGAGARRGVMPTDRRSLVIFAVLAALIIGGAGLSRARLWGGLLLAAAYAVAAFWYLRLATLGVRIFPPLRLAGTFAAAAFMFLPAVFVVRWRRFLR
jgi:hypothetical protein